MMINHAFLEMEDIIETRIPSGFSYGQTQNWFKVVHIANKEKISHLAFQESYIFSGRMPCRNKNTDATNRAFERAVMMEDPVATKL